LKNFAISAFGSHDKLVLVIGILVVLAIFAAGIGILATRRLAYGMTGLALFAFVGLLAAETRPSASLGDVLPTLAGAVAAALALVGGVGGKLLAERGNVAAARKSLRIPVPRSAAPPLPAGVDLKIPGLSPFITPNSSFYRVDTALVLPQIPPASWQLR